MQRECRGDVLQARDPRHTDSQWRKQYGGLMPSEMKRLRPVTVNPRRNKLVTDVSLDKALLQEVGEKCAKACAMACGGDAWRAQLAVSTRRVCQVRQRSPDRQTTITRAALRRTFLREKIRQLMESQEVAPHFGVDEQALVQRHRYLTVVVDLERRRFLYLAWDQKKERLDGFWDTLTLAQR